jgi:hypothetical protein
VEVLNINVKYFGIEVETEAVEFNPSISHYFTFPPPPSPPYYSFPPSILFFLSSFSAAYFNHLFILKCSNFSRQRKIYFANKAQKSSEFKFIFIPYRRHA